MNFGNFIFCYGVCSWYMSVPETYLSTSLPAPKPSNQTLFKGICLKLEGFIFDIGPHQASIYSKTKVEIVEYAGQTYSAAVRVAMSKLEGQEAKSRNTHVPGADTVA